MTQPPLAVIRLSNPGGQARVSPLTATFPVLPGTDLTRYSHVTGFGERRADGSYRFARVDTVTGLPNDSETWRFPVLPRGQDEFVFHPRVVQWIAFGSPISLQVNGGETYCTLKTDEAPTTGSTRDYTLVAMREDGFTLRMRLHVTSRSPVIGFDAGVTWQYVGGRAGEVGADLAIGIRGAEVRVDFADKSLLGQGAGEQGARLLMLDGQHVAAGEGGNGAGTVPTLADAQGPAAITGVIIPGGAFAGEIDTDTDKRQPLLAIAEGWEKSDSFGAFGYLPPLPPGSDSEALAQFERDYVASQFASMPAAMPLGHPYYPPGSIGLPDGTAPGNQWPARTIAFSHAARLLVPERLYYSLMCCLREQCRPNTYVDHDGSLFSAKKHPDTWLWNERPWNRDKDNVCPDPLGRPEGDLSPADTAPMQQGIGWYTWGRQHWLNSHLIFATLLTGHPWLRERLRYHAELMIASLPVKSGNVTLDGPDAARGAGRVLKDAAGYLLVLDSDDVRERLRDRIAQWLDGAVLPQWWKRYGPLADGLPTVPQPWDVIEPAPEGDPVNHPTDRIRHSNPWQEAILAEGLYAIAPFMQPAPMGVIGPACTAIADRIAYTVARWGTQLRDDGRAFVAIGVTNDGTEPKELVDGVNVDWGADAAYASWASAALLKFAERSQTLPHLAPAKALMADIASRLVKQAAKGEDGEEMLASVRNPWDFVIDQSGSGQP